MDLRRRVVGFVAQGGGKAEAARRFGVTRATVYNWLARGDHLAAHKPGPKGARKLDWDKLKKTVDKRPDLMLKELAQQFGVGTTAIWYALQQMKLSLKKRRSGMPKPVRSSGKHTKKPTTR